MSSFGLCVNMTAIRFGSSGEPHAITQVQPRLGKSREISDPIDGV
jgi:hypothetical protein